ncbi:MAG: PAS domain S-box protein [Actinomycetota bacterium]|nr:PAS domain S-box protein [Actinomycetota bacterium]MDP9486928.1 PAS domain S-box protein [Actinomycetota bacterium]
MALRDGRAHRSDAEVYWRKDGTSFPVEYVSNPVVEGGELMGAVVTFDDVAERKSTEEALRESEERFRSLIQNASDVVVLMTGDGTIAYVSPSVRRVWGYAPEDLVGTNAFGLVHPDDMERVRALHVEGNKTPGVKPVMELRMRRADGSWRCVEGIGNNLLDEPSVGGIVVTWRDVTERKKAEEQLRKSEESLRLVVEGVKDYAIFMLDPAGFVASWNEGARRIKGYEPEEIIGEHFSRFYPQEDARRGKPERELKVVLAEGRAEDEGWRVRRDGSRFWANVVITALRDEEGNLQGFSKVTRDITERKKAEEKLRKSEERFRSLVQNASDLISVLGADGTVLYESPAIERMLGYETDELVGRNVFDLVHPDDTPRVLRAFDKLSGGNETEPFMEYRFRHADGSWRHLESSGANLFDEPSVGGVVVNSRDVTERKLLEGRLTHQALHDPLTGLPNRALLLDRLTHAMERANRRGGCVAVLFMISTTSSSSTTPWATRPAIGCSSRSPKG